MLLLRRRRRRGDSEELGYGWRMEFWDWGFFVVVVIDVICLFSDLDRNKGRE